MQKVSDLREPPIIGRFYMVPVITYRWRGYVDHWPVLATIHHDREHIKFEALHYHFDGRFLTGRQFHRIQEVGGDRWNRAGFAINANVLAEHVGGRHGPLPRKPVLAKRKCQREIQPWVVVEEAKQWGLAQVYGDPAEPIRRGDGRLLCPHRKADLSQFPMDADGVVTCPLHGLRVQCGEPSTSFGRQAPGSAAGELTCFVDPRRRPILDYPA